MLDRTQWKPMRLNAAAIRFRPADQIDRTLVAVFILFFKFSKPRNLPDTANPAVICVLFMPS